MFLSLPEATQALLRGLAGTPGVLRAGMFDRAASSLALVTGDGQVEEAHANVRVLIEALLTAGDALCDSWRWDMGMATTIPVVAPTQAREASPCQLRLVTPQGALLLQRVDENRALVLQHQGTASSPRLAMALREAACRLPARVPTTSWNLQDGLCSGSMIEMPER